MRTNALAVALLLATTAPLFALHQDPGDKTSEGGRAAGPSESAADRLAAIRKEYEAANSAFSQAYRKATTDEERQKLIEELYPKPGDYLPRLWKIVAERGDEDGVADVLVWITQLDHGTDRTRALERLAADFVASPALADACRQFGEYTPQVDYEAFLRAVASKSPHRDAKALATYALAGVLRGQADIARRIAAGEENLAERYGAATVAKVGEAGVDALRDEAVALLGQVQADYGDVPHYRGSLADAASGDLFELKHLVVGQVAPEIEGEDLDGVAFKLSDYRGKVVLLDFWGNW